MFGEKLGIRIVCAGKCTYLGCEDCDMQTFLPEIGLQYKTDHWNENDMEESVCLVGVWTLVYKYLQLKHKQ